MWSQTHQFNPIIDFRGVLEMYWRVAKEVPDGYVGLFQARSSSASFLNGLHLTSCYSHGREAGQGGVLLSLILSSSPSIDVSMPFFSAQELFIKHLLITQGGVTNYIDVRFL